jgi:hypothetical protein
VGSGEHNNVTLVSMKGRKLTSRASQEELFHGVDFQPVDHNPQEGYKGSFGIESTLEIVEDI